jgi:hypothetical protein
MRPIDADALMEKLNGIWDCNDMTFEPVDGCCIDADCKSCRWRETIEYVKRLVQNQTTISPWHRVDEALPEPHRDVLVSGMEAINNSRVYKVMVNDNGTWRPTDYAPSIRWDYWMPIEPPKEDA